MAKLTDQQIEAQIDRAIARQSDINASEPRANKVVYGDGRLTLHFTNGAVFSFLVETVEAIATLPVNVLTTVELTPSGKGLRWDEPPTLI